MNAYFIYEENSEFHFV